MIFRHADGIGDFFSIGLGYGPVHLKAQHLVKRLGALEVGTVDIDVHHTGDMHCVCSYFPGLSLTKNLSSVACSKCIWLEA